MEGRKEVFYLTTLSEHFIYKYMFSDMVRDHSDNERGHPLSLSHGLLFVVVVFCFVFVVYLLLFFWFFQLAARYHLYTPRREHTTSFVTPVVQHWLIHELGGVDPVTHRTMSRRSTTELRLAPLSISPRLSLTPPPPSFFLVGSIPYGGPIELILVPASVPRLL